MKAILHADRNWGIGKNNGLMFKIPADMKFFKETTTGNVVVMGANTLKSFPGGNPLKDRVNVVLDTSGEEKAGCITVKNLDELFAVLKNYPDDKIYVIGGMMTYCSLLPYCDEVLVTKVDAVGDADAFFENLDENENFKLEYESEPQETNGYIIRFTRYRNKKVMPRA